MLPLASFLAPWAVSVIERCLSSWQLAQIGLSRPGTSRAGCCATAVREIAHRQEHSRLANVSNRIEHLPRVVHSDQRYPNYDLEVARATNCRSPTDLSCEPVSDSGTRNRQSRMESTPVRISFDPIGAQ
jgi:hypothetical protein